MNLKIELKPGQGYNKVFDVGEYLVVALRGLEFYFQVHVFLSVK